MTDTVPVTEAPAVVPDIAALPPADQRKPDDKIPTLELTWRDATEGLELTDESIARLIALKKAFGRVIVIPTNSDVYVARSCSRLEWRKVVEELGQVDETREQLTREGKSEAVVTQELTMRAEDKLVERFLVYPKLRIDEIRKLPPGEVKTVHDAIMIGLGYGQQPRAVRV